ncbi:uncharacterized protein LOC101852608 [Aplysia californica]|uniref:Uncharacterized protein LOC101852608 n=1 Tax=Aplysia californica TaxID=6500 RepID=A0ABM0JI11_APLCA|nr:uncharacterized protein LOC101852608 [Aplysia californica]
MDTPLAKKQPRRKLQKIIKRKSKVTPNGSLLYQKKVKSAINVSLNATQSLRTLKTNNRALATKLENLKMEMRYMSDAHTGLLQKNHELCEKILSLERLIEDPSSYIEEEVDKRNGLLCSQVKTKLRQMKSNVDSFLENLLDLSEICSMSNSTSTSDEHLNCETSHYSPEPKAAPEGQFSKPFGGAPLYSTMFSGVEAASQQTLGVNEMTMIMEQSALSSPNRRANVSSGDLPSLEENDPTSPTLSGPVKTVQLGNYSKLPVRVPKTSSLDGSGVNQDVPDPTLHLKTKKPVRRETFIVNPSGEVGGITDTTAPFDLVPSSEIDIYNSPSESLKNDKDFGREDKHVPEEESAIVSKRQSRSRSRERTESKNKTSSQKMQKQGRVALKDVNTTVKKSTIAPVSKKQDLYIANEFDLINSHKEIMHKFETLKQTKPQVVETHAPTYGPFECEEPTIHALADMELTIGIDSEMLNQMEESTKTEATSSCDANTEETSRSTLGGARSRGKNTDTSLSGSSGESACEEKVPGAVTLRYGKPGKFVFAAARKEEDGTRKNIPVNIPRARSKSKKQIAEMIDNLPQEEPKSIFDFHDKTPRINAEKTKEFSVYNISADDSNLSPLVPLSRSRRAQKADIQTFENRTSLLDEGESYSEALKDCSASSKSKDDGFGKPTRSRRSRKKSQTRDSSNLNALGDDETAEKAACVREKERKKSQARGEASSDLGKRSPSPQKRGVSTKSRGRSRSRRNMSSEPEDDSKEALSVVNTESRVPETAEINHLDLSSTKVSENDGQELGKCERSGMIGEGISYEEPLKCSPVERRGISGRKSRGRSRGKVPKSSDSDGKDNNDTIEMIENSRYQSRKLSEVDQVSSVGAENASKEMLKSCKKSGKKLLGEGISYVEPLKCNSPSPQRQRTRGKSRGRSHSKTAHSPVSEGEEKNPSTAKVTVRSRSSRRKIYSFQNNEETGRSSENTTKEVNSPKRGVLDEGITYEALKCDSPSPQRKNTRAKSRSRSQKKVEEKSEPSSEKNTAEMSPCSGGNVLGKGTTFQEPLKSVSPSPQKRKSRAKSRGRSQNKIERKETLKNTNNDERDSSNITLVTTKDLIASDIVHSISPRQSPLPQLQRKEESVTEDERFTSDKLSKKKQPVLLTEFSDSTRLRHDKSPLRVVPGTSSPKIKLMEKSHKKIVSKEPRKVQTLNEVGQGEAPNTAFGKHLDSPDGISRPEEPQKEMVASNKEGARKKSKPLRLKEQEAIVVAKDQIQLNSQAKVDKSEDNFSRRQKSRGKRMDTATSCESQDAFTDQELAQEKEDSAVEDFHSQCEELLQRMKSMRTPSLSGNKESTSVDGASPKNTLVPSKRSSPPPDTSDVSSPPEGKRRRAAAKVNYAEPLLNAKLRRGDPFTSNLYKGEKLNIFKSPRSKAKKKAELRRDILGPLHNLAEKEEGKAEAT